MNEFSLGKVQNKGGQANNKKKKPEDIGADRMKEVFNVGGGGKGTEHEDLKRKREEFAVQIRKKKK